MINNHEPQNDNSPFIKHFDSMSDPRRTAKGNYYYPLNEILLLVISGSDGWTSIELFGKTKLEWLRQFFPYENGIPSHDVLGGLFARLKSKEFTACFTNWVNSVADLTNVEVVAIDGWNRYI